MPLGSSRYRSGLPLELQRPLELNPGTPLVAGEQLAVKGEHEKLVKYSCVLVGYTLLAPLATTVPTYLPAGLSPVFFLHPFSLLLSSSKREKERNLLTPFGIF